MPTLILIRHAQASFGAADYDQLSPLGHEQSRALGQALRTLGIAPDAVCLGAQKRHRQTWEGINEALGHADPPSILSGFNEFDFGGLLEARYAGRVRPDNLHTERRAHFKALRETVLEWQQGEITDPPESYASFAARAEAMSQGHETVLVVSSGGAIGQTVAEIMGAPADAMIRLQLQIKNCAMARLIVTPHAEHMSTFNETPHITAANEARLLTYS